MDNTFSLKLAEKIAFFRAKKGVTQEVVAANLGVSNNAGSHTLNWCGSHFLFTLFTYLG